jgi:superfamily II DNA helicase RecQ
MELGNHSEFLGVMSQTEMLSTFFVHDGGDTSKWRLKGHAEVKFFEWIANWACVLQTPSDLGYEDEDKKYTLPEMNIIEKEVHVNDFETDNGQISLLPNQIQSLTERRKLRRESLKERVQKASEIANNIDDQVLIWCDMNAESELLTKSIKGAVEVKGSDKPEHKTKSMIDFKNGDIRVLVSKPSICGFGMNWQNCNNIIFVGLSDSFESYYQAVRRCWRFGQDKEVSVYIVISSAEGAVKANIERKQNNAQRMTSELVKFTKDILKTDISNTVRMSEKYITNERMVLPKWIA